MLRDFFKLSLWNLSHIVFIHFFQPDQSVMLVISCVAMLIAQIVVYYYVYFDDSKLVFYLPLITNFIFMLPLLQNHEVINLIVLAMMGELVCLIVCIFHYLELSTYITQRQSIYARLIGCPGH